MIHGPHSNYSTMKSNLKFQKKGRPEAAFVS